MEEQKNHPIKLTKIIGALTGQNYEIDKTWYGKLGEGAHGQVFRCRKQETYAPWEFAWKVMSLGIFDNETLQFVEQEFKIHWRISQTHSKYLVKLIDFVRSKRNYYIILERWNTSLLQVFSNRFATTEEARDITEHVMFAIRALKYENIVHCDLKLGNILKTIENGQEIYKLADFGMAVDLDQSNRSRGGTPYMAPIEQLKLNFKTKMGTHVDIWSLGIVIHKIWTGKHPYNIIPTQQTRWQVLEQLQNNDLQLDEDLDPQLSQILERMLQKKYKNRATIDEVLHSDFILPQTSRLNLSGIRISTSSHRQSVDSANEETVTNNQAISQNIQNQLQILDRMITVMTDYQHGPRKRLVLANLLQSEAKKHYISIHELISYLGNPFQIKDFKSRISNYDPILAANDASEDEIHIYCKQELQDLLEDLQNARASISPDEWYKLKYKALLLCEVLGDIDLAQKLEQENF